MIREKGFTIVELLLTMAILGVVLTAVIESYSNLLRHQVQQQSIAKANLEEGISLEILRRDIEMAGFGLPWDMNGFTYSEALSSSSYTPDPATFNDDPNPPRAFVMSDNGNTSANNSDVLVIRSTVAALNSESQRWGYVSNDGTTISYSPLSSDSSNAGYFTVLDRDRKLESQNYQPSDSTPPVFPDALDVGDIYFTFGLDNITPRMPFNRVDYYLERPTSGFPSTCSPNSWRLYRATISHVNGQRSPQPVLDCVKDFQVAFGLDTNDDDVIDSWSSSVPSTASTVRERVKQVRVFIVYQEGQKTPDYTFSGSITLGDSDTGTLKTFTPSGDDTHYRWKVLRLVVSPLNLEPQER